MGGAPIHGLYFSDTRLISALHVTVDGERGEHISTALHNADRCTFVSLVRAHDTSPDPGLRLEHTRAAASNGASETVTLISHLPRALETTVVVTLTAGFDQLDLIKAGLEPRRTTPVTRMGADTVRWAHDGICATLVAPDADVWTQGDTISLTWRVAVPAGQSVSVRWQLTASDSAAVTERDHSPQPWFVPAMNGDDRLRRWVEQALCDLDGLRMTTTAMPELGFVAAGAPWFLTLFGRDSIWAARFMLPLGTELAWDTLRVLASMQGTSVNTDRAEEPGKILHELRRSTVHLEPGTYLPPLYFGTVDATPLWICLLHDAWRWGLDDACVNSLLPHLRAAMGWLRDHADADGDGLLEYVDRSGHGLANQGWKDSGDSVQWNDGTLAQGPIALCEVQAYAYEAALGGAELLEHFGEDAEEWRGWAARLKMEFRSRYWVEDKHGPFPAIALDSAKRPVDTVTSNIGHLLGTGILDADEEALVAARLVSPELNSGFGIRTLSTAAAGYWPLSYHCGSVWTHDTAISIAGLTRAGFYEEAREIIDGLLRAAAAFDYRMPELHSGDSASSYSRPSPYPAACRPQAWSSAASVSVLASSLRLTPGNARSTLLPSPSGSEER